MSPPLRADDAPVSSPSGSAGTPGPDGLIARVVRWLRAGYPEGVPQQDYLALLGILRRSLTPQELGEVVSELTDEAEAGEQAMTRPLVEQRIADVVKGPIDEKDVARVSARLAAAGWPLGSPLRDPAADAVPEEARGGLVVRVVDWLRAGYPSGVPDNDFVPLLALLRRRLTDDEVREVAAVLKAGGTTTGDRVDIGSAIAEVTTELPSEADIARVSAYLADHGWPSDFTS